MLLTITEAAEAAGIARSTLYRAIESGEITRRPDKRIDVADLIRVYGELRMPEAKGQGGEGASEPMAEGAAAELGSPTASPELVSWLQSIVDQQQATIARKDAELERRAAELREAEERAADERRGLLAQLDRTVALLPAPAEPPSESEPSRGFWQRLLGT